METQPRLFLWICRFVSKLQVRCSGLSQSRKAICTSTGISLCIFFEAWWVESYIAYYFWEGKVSQQFHHVSLHVDCLLLFPAVDLWVSGRRALLKWFHVLVTICHHDGRGSCFINPYIPSSYHGLQLDLSRCVLYNYSLWTFLEEKKNHHNILFVYKYR